MKLSEADRQQIVDWINDKCGNMRCTCCGQGHWVVGEISTLSLGFDVHTTRFHYHDGMPQVTILCGNCGHLVHFSPGVMGFKPTPPKPPAIEQDADQGGGAAGGPNGS